MVQALDDSINRPNYNAVKINIKNPAVNKGQTEGIADDNGIYNGVSIDIDNPSVNADNKKIYSYPEADNIVTYDMIKPASLPQGFHVAYQTTNVILPKIENEVEIEGEEVEDADAKEEAVPAESEAAVAAEKEGVAQEEVKDEKPEVPEPSYTTTEAEKAPAAVEFKAASDVKRPEIIPGEEIKPDVDIPRVVSNLTNNDFDIQAQQMEEIARISLDNPENAVPYIVRDVFSSLIDITKKDSANLAMPTDEQIAARRKVIANYIALENAKQPAKMPYQLTEKELALANEISPMEQAERNKEYALYTIAILAKIYTDEVEKQTGNIVPMTDIPGTSAIVDALRYNPNSGVKVAAIDALSHIQRPEYKEELTTLFTLAEADRNPEVAISASRAIQRLNEKGS